MRIMVLLALVANVAAAAVVEPSTYAEPLDDPALYAVADSMGVEFALEYDSANYALADMSATELVPLPPPADPVPEPVVDAGTPAPEPSVVLLPALTLTLPASRAVVAAMNRLAELGANLEELRFFDCLMWFESSYRWWVTSPWSDYGLLQINQIHSWRWVGRDIFDPIVNAEVAWDIYRESGFRAWSAAKFCYLPARSTQ